jgi:hypothetical protein
MFIQLEAGQTWNRARIETVIRAEKKARRAGSGSQQLGSNRFNTQNELEPSLFF